MIGTRWTPPAVARLTVACLTVAATCLVPAATTHAAERPQRCSRGYVCVWSRSNATGAFCRWKGDDPDWRAGKRRCAFRVNTVWNNQGRSRVRFYRATRYRGLISDPLPATPRPLNAANLRVSSHRWTR